ncbi:hypothetical protein WR164_03510 [Philodulcilactobacillus myokoensis]|uniref:Uncharacterized protein n=1 Tax=Philodulcilactobacillus myokoensis TaxID=2929573 RepID=A0A9W6ESD4_9LACO|nr:hypothetical protein [Philodulcilactobacillus myokoensis]GLB46372.1 hypothetical protein WR164_03510 [Philodulcilactobacillus myokoensis]
MLLRIKGKWLEIGVALFLMIGPFGLENLFLSDLVWGHFFDRINNGLGNFLFVSPMILLLLTNMYIPFTYIHDDFKHHGKGTPKYRKFLAGCSIMILFMALVILCMFESSIGA